MNNQPSTPILSPLRALLHSRKFLLAVFAVIQTLILHYLDVPRDVWLSIEALVIVLIGAIAWEDGQAKGQPTTVNTGTAGVVNVPVVPTNTTTNEVKEGANG